MPGGSTGGAQAGGRFYRNASLSIADSLTQIAFDTDSSLLVPDNIERVSGDMKTNVAGKGIILFSMKSAGVALLTGIHVVMTRSPGTAREAVFVDCNRRAPTTGAFTVDVGGAVDLDVDDTVRIEAAAEGVSLLALTVGGELNTWAHLLIG